MRKKNTELLKDVLNQVLQEQGLKKKLNDLHLMEAWSVVLGKNITQYTKHLSIKNSVLYATLTSAVLRHDLFLSREEIIKALNNHVGEEVIKDIVFQ